MFYATMHVVWMLMTKYTTYLHELDAGTGLLGAEQNQEILLRMK